MSNAATPMKRTLLSIMVLGALLTGAAQADEPIDEQLDGQIEEKSTQSNSVSTPKADIDLSRVVVTAGGFAQEVKEAPASISLVSNKELETKPFRDVTDALKDIPGVSVTGGGGSTDISIRGMAPQYTLMLIDGRRMSSRATRPNSDGSGIEQGWIPPLAAIERIEVVRGPMSSRYGSDAMGGVINVITKKVADEWGGSLRLESTLQEDSDAGNMNTVDFYLNGPIMKERLGLQLYGKYSDRSEDKYMTGFPEQRIENLNGKLTFVPVDGHTLELTAGVGLQKRFATKNQTSARGSEHKSKRTHGSLRYLGEWDNGVTSDIAFSHEKTDNYVRKMIVDNYVVDGNVIIPLGSHTVTVGGQYRKEKLEDQGNQFNPDLVKIDRYSYAGFIEDEWWITDSFSLTAGLRYDKDENYGGNLNPRIYGVWNINDEFTMKGGISTGFTAPGLRQVVADWGQVTGGGTRDGMILGNPDLQPEKSTNYELSLNYSNDYGVNASVTGFYTNFKDKIQLMTLCDDESNQGECAAPNGEGFDLIQKRFNIDKAELKGLELALSMPINEFVSVNGSYTYTKTKQKTGEHKGDPLTGVPEHQFNLGVDWDINEKTQVWAKARYNGKEYQMKKGVAGKRNDSFTTFDLGASYKFSDDATLYAGIYNVGNKKIREIDHGYTQDGRRYWVGVNVDF